MTRPPHAASSVVGYASDTASAVAKVEPNSNRSRETGRPYCYVEKITLGKSLKSSLSLFVPSLRFFKHLENMISPF